MVLVRGCLCLLTFCSLVLLAVTKDILPLIASPVALFHALKLGTKLLSSSSRLADASDVAYIVNLEVGGQTLPVIVDTGSYDLWVVSTSCIPSDCGDVPKYKPTRTFKETSVKFNLNYLNGSVSGRVAYETILLGQYQMANQVFALANNTPGLDLPGIGNSGILGLSLSRTAGIPLRMGQSFVYNILSHLDEPLRFFAIRLGRVNSPGTLTIGAHDPAMSPYISRLSFYDVLSTDGNSYDYWKIPLDAMDVGASASPMNLSPSKIPSANRPIAVFDTGTTLILGPTEDVRRFWIWTGGARQVKDGTWEVRCDLAIQLGFRFASSTFFIDPSDLSRKGGREPDGWCTAGIQANDNVIGGDWLLGDAFLKNVYISHHITDNGTHAQVGIVGLTDPQSSLLQFRAVRGSPTATPASTLLLADPSQVVAQKLRGRKLLSILAALTGFLCGLIAVIIFRIQTASKRAKRRLANRFLEPLRISG